MVFTVFTSLSREDFLQPTQLAIKRETEAVWGRKMEGDQDQRKKKEENFFFKQKIYLDY